MAKKDKAGNPVPYHISYATTDASGAFLAHPSAASVVSVHNWSWVFTAVLALYGLTVNVPRWDFGKLLGIYVVLFFLVAQVLAKVRFGQTPTPPILVGGVLIVAGGVVIAFWK